MLPRKIFILVTIAIGVISYHSLALAQQTKAIKAVDLLAEPTVGAKKSGTLTVGQAISVLEKKGFWVKVQSSNQSGWVKLTDIELPNTVTKIDPLSTGRASGGNIVNTAGVRGLSPDELKNAKPNSAAVDQATQISQSITTTDIAGFASSGGVVTRTNVPEVKAVKISNSGNVLRQDSSSNTGNVSGSNATINPKPAKKDSNEW
jgi:hypothetical protein